MSAITRVRLIQLTAVAAFALPMSLFLPSLFHAALLVHLTRFSEEKAANKKRRKGRKEEDV